MSEIGTFSAVRLFVAIVSKRKFMRRKMKIEHFGYRFSTTRRSVGIAMTYKMVLKTFPVHVNVSSRAYGIARNEMILGAWVEFHV